MDNAWEESTSPLFAFGEMKAKILQQALMKKWAHTWSAAKSASSYTKYILSQACALLDSDASLTIKGVVRQFKSPYSTLCGCYQQFHCSSHTAHKKEQLQNSEDGQVMLDLSSLSSDL